ncbi:DUF1203 domain-containing protein [Glycocaulis abyssi]|uniref:DUF1203 domain-containing protein n=1 Tax=Glycocaulis abyssi TaxID=1433403 RepID=A0ABV9NA29_9PROT
MSYIVRGLDPQPFAHLFGQSGEALEVQGVFRFQAEAGSGLPDRVELRDLEPGETALLVNHVHQPANTPYRASHAIFVLENAVNPAVYENIMPPALQTRLLSLRALDAAHMMVDGDVVEGREAPGLITRMFANRAVSYIHAHYARRGCFAALIDRG